MSSRRANEESELLIFIIMNEANFPRGRRKGRERNGEERKQRMMGRERRVLVDPITFNNNTI